MVNLDSEERQDDVVELFDMSCMNEDEKHWPQDFKLNYKRTRKVLNYHEDVPTAFVRIPKVGLSIFRFMKNSFFY